jgi:hypothetical protein
MNVYCQSKGNIPRLSVMMLLCSGHTHVPTIC